MSFFCNGYNGYNNNGYNSNLAKHMYEFIGDTVTIFTTSGGASGNGFTGVLMSVNNNFVRLMTEQGSAPSDPINRNHDGHGPAFGFEGVNSGTIPGSKRDHCNRLGSICDIPIENIAVFCHNAV